MSRKELGIIGEATAYKALTDAGLKVIAKNYRCSLGEIDIIALDGERVVFVEVKTRTTIRRGLPEEAVTYSKRRAMIRTALVFLKERGLLEAKTRFDVIAIEGDTVRYIKSAFDASDAF